MHASQIIVLNLASVLDPHDSDPEPVGTAGSVLSPEISGRWTYFGFYSENVNGVW